MNEEEPINEFTTQPLMTREFLEKNARRGKEHISILDKALAELYLELGITDEDQ